MTTRRYFASGTGAAGLVGALLWWELRALGVRTGVGLSSVRRPNRRSAQRPLTAAQMLPLVIPATYFLLLPRPAAFNEADIPSVGDEAAVPAVPYIALPTGDGEEAEADEPLHALPEAGDTKNGVALSAGDKWRLVKPLLPKYMLPLCQSYVPSLSARCVR